MKRIEKVIKSILIIYVLIVLGMTVFNIIEPLLYGKGSVGTKTNKEYMYDISHAIIARKYENILYDNYENMYDIFSYNCKNKLKDVYSNGTIEKILNYFESFQITDIQQKNKNIYIVNYNEVLSNNEQNQIKMIIKYKNDKAIIYYDGILEEDNA